MCYDQLVLQSPTCIFHKYNIYFDCLLVMKKTLVLVSVASLKLKMFFYSGFLIKPHLQ